MSGSAGAAPVNAAKLQEPLRVGRVARAVGLTGEVEVRLDWAESRGLQEATRVVLEAPGGQERTYDVQRARRSPKGMIVALAGVSDRDAAEALAGQAVSIPRDALPALGAGEYYLCDLVGARAFGPDGLIGTVVEVQVYPSVDAVVLETPSGERLEQPLLDHWIAEVDVAAGRIVLSATTGLIEVPRPRAADARKASDEAGP